MNRDGQIAASRGEPLAEPERADRGSAVDVAGEPRRTRSVSSGSASGSSAASTGAELIAAERQRQIDAEDWTPSHDDTHARGELALAAAVYAVPPSLRDKTVLRLFWPWERSWFKPNDRTGGENAGTIFETDEWRAGRVRTLAKAGALVAAEIDRLQRRAES